MDNNTKQLDSYSILIVSKYFESTYDYINIICVCKKFKETTEKLRFNPIPITTLKLFPKIQTQYLYDESDIKISGVGHFEIWFKVDYNQYLENKVKGIKCHHVKYNEEHRKQYGNDIPIGVSILENDCYSYCDIKNITIPNQVTSIGKGCFYDCSKLTHVLLSNGLTSISYSCFYKCVGLTSMTIPPSVQKLGSNCFARCYNLETIEIPDSVTSIDSSTFRNCEWLKSVRLPPSLHTLKSWTFRLCFTLKSVIFPTTLTSIGSECFLNCTNLVSVQLPQSLKELGMRCFEGCGIREIEIPKSVESIGIECFLSCSSLTNLVTFPKEHNSYSFKVSHSDSILYNKFGIGCPNVVLTGYDVRKIVSETHHNTFTIPKTVVELDDFCFSYNGKISKLIIPTSVTSIGDNCFEECYNLTSLTIPSSVKFIGRNIFNLCPNLRIVNKPKDLIIETEEIEHIPKLKIFSIEKQGGCSIC